MKPDFYSLEMTVQQYLCAQELFNPSALLSTLRILWALADEENS